MVQYAERRQWSFSDGRGGTVRALNQAESARSNQGRMRNVMRALCFTLLCVLSASVFISLDKGRPTQAATVQSSVVYTVKSGDTLWNIALHKTGATVGTEREVEHIMEANHMQSAAIYPGERLMIPSRTN